MTNPIYEPIDENLDRPATRADVEKVLRAIENLSERINYKSEDTL
jgi:hypothetical protein